MKIYVLIPVFNRLQYTKKVIEALRVQKKHHCLEIIVINDGSTDGTGEYLATQRDLTVINGDGDLWWAGAMEKGLQHARKLWDSKSYVLFLNNDTWFSSDYIDVLLDAATAHQNSIIGSVIHEENRPIELAYIGPKININRLQVTDLVFGLTDEEKKNPKPFYLVDALSGRGTLFPAYLFDQFGFLTPKLLPHYLADYEITMRFARHGVSLLVASNAIVYSPPEYGNSTEGMALRTRLFSRRSSENILYRIVFYSLVGNFFQRLTGFIRVLYYTLPSRVRII